MQISNKTISKIVGRALMFIPAILLILYYFYPCYFSSYACGESVGYTDGTAVDWTLYYLLGALVLMFIGAYVDTNIISVTLLTIVTVVMTGLGLLLAGFGGDDPNSSPALLYIFLLTICILTIGLIIKWFFARRAAKLNESTGNNSPVVG